MNQELKILFLSMLDEVPDDTILVKYMERDGEWSCKRIREDLEKDGNVSKDYFTDLLRTSRDILIHKAKKK